jgi:hypothetical protein
VVLDDDSVLPDDHLGRGTCYIEFGEGRIGSVDIDFLSGPTKTGTFNTLDRSDGREGTARLKSPGSLVRRMSAYGFPLGGDPVVVGRRHESVAGNQSSPQRLDWDRSALYSPQRT